MKAVDMAVTSSGQIQGMLWKWVFEDLPMDWLCDPGKGRKDDSQELGLSRWVDDGSFNEDKECISQDPVRRKK